MSHSIPRMAWRLFTSSSLVRRCCTLNGSPACNSAPPMNPARRNAAAMEPARRNAPATRPPAARAPRQRARTHNAPVGHPYASRTTPVGRWPPVRPTRPPATRVQQKKRRYPQGAAAPRSVTQASARTGRGSRERTARPRRRPRRARCRERAGRTSSYCQPCS